MTKIYVGNLPFSADETQVRQLFEQHGTVELFTKGTEPTKSAGSKIDPTEFYKLDQMQESPPPVPVEP